MKKKHRQIFLDTETTGIGIGHRILELGAIESIDRKLTGNDFHYIIDPQREIEETSMNIHGITYDIVHGKPLFADIVDEFLDYVRAAELIIHNAPFDIKMLDYELQLLSKKQSKKYGKMIDYCQITDSLLLSRKVFKKGKHSLDALCYRYRIDRRRRLKHSALLDCSLLFEVYINLTNGQIELFNKDSLKKNKEKINPKRDYRKINLPEVVVSQEEESSHQNFMDKITSNIIQSK